MSFKIIEESLNMKREDYTPPPALEEKEEGIIEVEIVDDADHTKEDYDLSRKTLKDLMEVGSTAVKEAANVAKESDAPKAFDALGNLIKTVGDTSTKLMDLQKINKEVAKKKEGDTINNNLFVGSTTDLQKFLDKNKNENI